MAASQCSVISIVFVGGFASNGYPFSYFNEEWQSWLMCGSRDHQLCIQFTDLATENGHDNVTVVNQSGIIVQSYSGDQIPSKIKASSNLKVTFSTDNS